MKKVLCHGCWDVLHYGHIAHLTAAKKFGDYLIVSVTADKFVNKGPGRPYFPQDTRAEMLRSLKIVDEVVISNSPIAVDIINKLKPDVYVKGKDYANGEFDIDLEAKAVKSYGGEVEFTDEATNSSSKIINNVLAPWTDDQKYMIDKIKRLGGVKAIEKILDKISNLKVLVVGEQIRDVYRYVTPQGVSSKSPSLSCRFFYEESFKGGALAVKRHLDSFCKVWQRKSKINHTKIRYISEETNQRLFEVVKHPYEMPISKIDDKGMDILIVCDFGHGLFPDMDFSKNTFTCLNVQTNSSNYGFNVVHRHTGADYICIDKRELSVATRMKSFNFDFIKTLRAYKKLHKIDRLSVTLGNRGSIFLGEKRFSSSPAFASDIKDTIGAGDAYFAITSLLVKIEADENMIVFLGNVFAGLKTQIIGNKKPVTKNDLLKACKSILA